MCIIMFAKARVIFETFKQKESTWIETELEPVPAVTSVLVVAAVTVGAAGGSELGVGGFAASAEELWPVVSS